MNATDRKRVNALAVDDYRKTRKLYPFCSALHVWQQAKHAAKAQVLWDKLNGWTLEESYMSEWSPIDDRGPVRLRVEPDLDYRIEDMFDPAAYDDPDKALQAERETIERDGAWGTVGEYWDGEEWQHADSCWGHVGYKDPSDPFENAYAADIMLATIAAYRATKHCPRCHRPART